MYRHAGNQVQGRLISKKSFLHYMEEEWVPRNGLSNAHMFIWQRSSEIYSTRVRGKK